MGTICALIEFNIFLDSTISSLATSDLTSNPGTDADLTAFDTDLPAAHNVSAF